MSSDSNITANANGGSAPGSGGVPKPNCSSGSTKKAKKSRIRSKPKETGEKDKNSSEKKGKHEPKRSKDLPQKKDFVQPKDVNENSGEVGPVRPGSKGKSKSNTTALKDSKRAAKERALVERYDAKFLRKPLLEYGTPACSLAVHHLPPNLDEDDFLLQASKLSPMSTKYTKFYYQQGSQPADLLDSTVYSVANFEFDSADHSNAVRMELYKKPFVDADSETKYVCEAIKPIIGGVVEVSFGEQDDPTAAVNSPIFKQFCRLREKGEPINLSQMFATVMEEKTGHYVQDSKKVNEAKKEEKLKKRGKKKSEARTTAAVSAEKKPPKQPKQASRLTENEGGDKNPTAKPKRPKRRKNVSDKKASNSNAMETTKNASHHSEGLSAA